LKFIGPCHVDADVSPISTKGGPDLSATLAEGDGRTWIISQQKPRSAQQASDQLHRQSLSVGGLKALPSGTFLSRKTIPQDGDEVLPGFIPPRQAGMEDRPSALKKTHGMHGCFLPIHYHRHSHAACRSPFFFWAITKKKV
jgi:hypothetical protein